MVSNQTQSSALLKVFHHEYLNRVHEMEDTLTSNAHRRVLFEENPCHYGCWLVAIQEGIM